MALEENLLVFSYDAAGPVAQHRFVAPDVGGEAGTGGHMRVAQVDAADTQPIGISQGKTTAAGQALSIAIIGQSMIEAGAAFDVGTPLTTDAAGRAIPAGAGAAALGFATQGAAAENAIASIMLMAVAPTVAA